MTYAPPVIVPESREHWSEPERQVMAGLAALCDISDPHYTVQSRLPGVGRGIAWLRRNMTTHLREAYFDRMVERQVKFNQSLVDGLRAAWQLVKERYDAHDVLLARANAHAQGISREVLEKARRTLQKDYPLNADWLAGPLPEYGECLGREWYRTLYTASLQSMTPASEWQKQRNASLVIGLHKLALQIEDKRLQLAAFYVKSLQADVMLRDYEVRSNQRYVGPLIAWIRRSLTSHLRESYIDPVLERQVAFNRWAAECLNNIYAPDHQALQRLQSSVDVMQRDETARPRASLPSRLVIWGQKHLTSHLREPYITPIFERQVAFNAAVVHVPALIQQAAAAWRAHDRDEGWLTKSVIQKEIAQFKEQFSCCSSEGQGDLLAGQGEFDSLLSRLLEQMEARVEALL